MVICEVLITSCEIPKHTYFLLNLSILRDTETLIHTDYLLDLGILRDIETHILFLEFNSLNDLNQPINTKGRTMWTTWRHVIIMGAHIIIIVAHGKHKETRCIVRTKQTYIQFYTNNVYKNKRTYMLIWLSYHILFTNYLLHMTSPRNLCQSRNSCDYCNLTKS
jgi:hypothetical protein